MIKRKKTILLLSIICIALILLIPLLWVIILGGMWIFLPTPSQPQEKYGEFCFELTYKINDETITVRDTYICEYDGIGFDEGNGKYRKWNGYIKGTGEDAIFITEDEDRKIYCFVGDAAYYMGEGNYIENESLTPRLYNVKNNIDVESLSPEQIKEYYKIEIISWTFSKPIKNSFE